MTNMNSQDIYAKYLMLLDCKTVACASALFDGVAMEQLPDAFTENSRLVLQELKYLLYSQAESYVNSMDNLKLNKKQGCYYKKSVNELLGLTDHYGLYYTHKGSSGESKAIKHCKGITSILGLTLQHALTMEDAQEVFRVSIENCMDTYKDALYSSHMSLRSACAKEKGLSILDWSATYPLVYSEGPRGLAV